MPRDYRNGVQDGPRHLWLPGVRDGSPIMACASCQKIWWPVQFEPKGACPGPDLTVLGDKIGAKP